MSQLCWIPAYLLLLLLLMVTSVCTAACSGHPGLCADIPEFHTPGSHIWGCSSAQHAQAGACMPPRKCSFRAEHTCLAGIILLACADALHDTFEGLRYAAVIK